MSEPVLSSSNLDAETLEVAAAWTERCHDIFLEEGRQLHIDLDALPLLVCVICEMRPGISPDEMVSMAEAIRQEFMAGMKLHAAEPMGEA